MNPTLHQLTALAERAQPEPGRFKVAWEIYSGDDLLAKGWYNQTQPRDRQAFAQAVGKLLAAGFEVATFMLDEDWLGE